MRSILLTLLLISLLPTTSIAQKLEFKGDFLLFREAKTKQPVLIINDSLMYKGNDIKRIAFKHTQYPARLNEYVFFNIAAKTYLVHDGCGPVLEYRNDSIVRIDNSFLHRNQFGAVKFIYNKEIYFYGGYGLFTYKNILTKYDFQNREWIEVQTYSETPLETRAGSLSYLIDNNLYIYGGVKKDENNVLGRKKLDNLIWRLNLPTMQWSCSGMKSNVTQLDNLAFTLFKRNPAIINYITDVYNEIYTEKNIVNEYELKFTSAIFANYFEGGNIICVFGNGTNKKNQFAILPINAVKGKQLSTSAFISFLPPDNSSIIILTLVLALCILLFIFIKIINPKLKPFDGIIYNHQKDLFLFKNKPITNFDQQEKKLLLYLIEQDNQYISLNDLNQLFENSNQSETISATVKRREQAISRLLVKISKMTGIDEEELIHEQKNNEDKRIKDLKILPNLLKKV